MKIFYAVQATGNGHISRAMQLLPYLRRYGNVDIFLSGSNSQLNIDAPVRFRSKGLSLFYKSGGLDYWKIVSTVNPVHVYDEVKDLPVENYDVVINDFECITSLACAYKKIPSVNFGHQASFQSRLAPRPKRKELMGELILKNYARATQYLGLHFEEYDNFIHTPVIKKEVLQAKPVIKDHITVYLSSYTDEIVFNSLSPVKGFRFHVFSRQVTRATVQDNVTFIPVSDRAFTESMIGSAGVITGAGFETPAEALHLKKKLLVIPIRGQYEQMCNAAALERMGVTVLQKMDASFPAVFDAWMQSNTQKEVQYGNIAPQVINRLFEDYPYTGASLDLLYPNLIFN
ncbi:MAG: glycosyl transferase [Bacteroidetes bacterium]|nr:glycosyl transferase [Bacteroidota bacterium]